MPGVDCFCYSLVVRLRFDIKQDLIELIIGLGRYKFHFTTT